MIKYTNEHPDRRDAQGNVWEGIWSLHALSVCYSPSTSMYSLTSLNPIFGGFLWSLHHVDMTDH